MAHAHIHLFCASNVGVLGRRGNFLSDWNLARFLSVASLTMDEDTKFVLQMWRVQVMVNEQLQRQVHMLEKELWELKNVRERVRTDDSFTDWRRTGSRRRRDADRSD